MRLPENSVPGVMVLVGAILVAVGIASFGSCIIAQPRDVAEMLGLGTTLFAVGVPLLLFGLYGRRTSGTQTFSSAYKKRQGAGVLLAAFGAVMVFQGDGSLADRLLLYGSMALVGIAAYLLAPWFEKQGDSEGQE